MSVCIIDRNVIALDTSIRDCNENIAIMLYKGMRVGIDTDNGCLVNWSPANDFLVLSMSSTKDFESVWIDLENQANHKQVTLQIRI